ncbi:MAG: ABC transporter substrate-binding protein, partial [Anaerolineae bacterium]|nr:ABC transporter substrate-binding protein [Anaerolineae bacterium]
MAVHKSVRLVLFLLFTMLLAVGVAVSAQDAGVLRVGMNAPVVLDPALHSNDPETALNRAIYDYLVEVAPDSTIVPNLATEWTISEDGLTYTFTLASGVTFHDGSPFTSADVVYTFERLKEVSSPAINLLGSDFTVSAPDDATVVFTLTSVNADF